MQLFQFVQIIKSNFFVNKTLAISSNKNGCISIFLLFSFCTTLASTCFL